MKFLTIFAPLVFSANLLAECASSPNSFSVTGSTITLNESVVQVMDSTPNQFGVLLVSPLETPPLPWFGGGNLCVNPGAPGYFRTQTVQADFQGNASLVLPDPFDNFDSQYIQWWHRDPQMPFGGSTSNSLQVSN